MSFEPSYERYRALRFDDAPTGVSVDLSSMGFDPQRLEDFGPAMARAFTEMEALENGAIANPDENRAVGHYWLRNAGVAPASLRQQIEDEKAAVIAFADDVRTGKRFPPAGGRYRSLCLIGIGGSALGPQLVIDALGDGRTGLEFSSLDNTDPDGIARALGRLDLATTLFLVISKSGGTKETRNAMLEARAACERAKLRFAAQAVAITGEGSELDSLAIDESWVARFPMHDWVGGRTSVCSAVGLLPASLCGIDMDAFLDGARIMDESTRTKNSRTNPAAQLALAFWLGAEGRGARNLVVLPYCDRLLLFGRYLQQLIMESLGKATDLEGKYVAQGLTVYGNKGSTDQHAYVQQLRDGVADFFACFVRVLDDGVEDATFVEPGITSADFLHGFYLGTRRALAENDRASLTITVPRLGARELGMLVALFERTVGLYASLAGINAYHQPGVEAGKRGAADALALRARILDVLDATGRSVEDIASAVASDDLVTIHHLLEHMAANSDASGVAATGEPGRFRRRS